MFRALQCLLCVLLSVSTVFAVDYVSSQGQLTVQVFDSSTGDPIKGVPVKVGGLGRLASTDLDGVAHFEKASETTDGLFRIWVSYPGYAPAFREIPVDGSRNYIGVLLVKSNSLETSNFPAGGGTYSFDRSSFAGLPEDHGIAENFFLELVVPAGAVEEGSRIQISPYPSWAAGDNGISELPLIQMAFSVVDRDGLESQFLNPISVNTRSSIYDVVDLNHFSSEPIPWALGFFDANNLEIVLDNNLVATVNYAEQSIGFQILPNSRYSVVSVYAGDPFYWGADHRDYGLPMGGGGGRIVKHGKYIREKNKKPGSPSWRLEESYQCEVNGSVALSCGTTGAGEVSAEIAKGTETAIAAGLEASLTTQFGAEGKASIFAKISASASSSVKGSGSTSLTLKSTQKIAGAIKSGAQIRGMLCYSGSVKLWKISKKIKVVAGAFSVEVATIPQSFTVTYYGQGDPDCDCTSLRDEKVINPPDCED